MTSGFLELQFRDDGDGTGFLSAEARHEKYAGASEACFSIDQLLEFAAELGQFPIENQIRVAGGYWSRDQPGLLEQEHLAMAVSPTDSRGGIAIQVRTATQLHEGDRAESQHSAALEIPVQYEDLRRFGRAIADLVGGKRETARIESQEAV